MCHLRVSYVVIRYLIMSDDLLPILISIPSKEYQFEYELLQSLIQHIQTENEDFKRIQVKMNMKIIDHSNIKSHTEHVNVIKNLQPYFSVIVVCYKFCS